MTHFWMMIILMKILLIVLLALESVSSPIRLQSRRPRILNIPQTISPAVSASLPEIPLTFRSVTAQLLCQLTLGTPGQPFDLLIDTQYSDFYVSSKECQYTAACLRHHTFDSAKSKTYVKNGSKFDLGDITGYLGEDLLGGLGTNEPQIVFGQVTKYTNRIPGVEDGIFGLGQDPGEIKSTNVIQALYQKKEIPENSYSIYLSRNHTGKLVLGGINPTYNSTPFTYVSLKGDYDWSIPITSISFNGSKIEPGEKLYGVFDSATSLIVGPPEVVGVIIDSLGKIECSQVDLLPKITFVIGNLTVELNGEDYVVKDGRNCIVNIMAEDFLQRGTIVLGSYFIRAYYTHFDIGKSRIGLAKAR